MKPRDKAWLPADYTPANIEAIKAVYRGDADAFQQRQVLDWIINNAAGAYELSFRSDADGGERETAFAEGRRFVGMQIVKLVNMSPDVVAALRNKNG